MNIFSFNFEVSTLASHIKYYIRGNPNARMRKGGEDLLPIIRVKNDNKLAYLALLVSNLDPSLHVTPLSITSLNSVFKELWNGIQDRIAI